MADAAKKAQKLAAARKKLKEFQQKGVKSVKNDENPASSVTTTNSSRHSSISNGNSIDYTPDRVHFESENQQSSSLHNYFNGHEQSNFFTEQRGSEPTNFFDNLPVYNSAPSNNFFETPKTGSYPFEPNINDDVKSLDYPEVESRNVYGYYASDEHPTVSSEDAKRLTEFLGGNENTVGTNSVGHDQGKLPVSQVISTYPSYLIEKEEQVEQTLISVSLPEVVMDVKPQLDENLESLSSIRTGKPEISKNEFESQIKEYELKIAQLENKLEQNQVEYEHKLSTELNSLQERLNGHVKTIEMYIAENNVLSDSLYQNQMLVKQKTSESEDLQGRLKASRSRVADLEKELQAVKAEKSKHDQAHVYEVEIKQLEQQYEELKQLKDETNQDLLELREKLNIKANENIGLQRELQEVTHQLSLAQIKIEQISLGENSESQSHIETLNRQKVELEKQILDLSQILKTLGEEKVQTNLQYQHYVQQLNAQVATLANKLETSTTENETLSKREQSLIKHIGELEKHLQSLQEEKVNFANKGGYEEVKKELDAALALTETLQKEKEELQEKYQHICTDQDDMLAELANKRDVIEQLENELEQLKVDQPDSAKLLAAIESDKVAASRAVAQNTTLKQELEEMQQAFVRMSNDKLELTEQLSAERYKNQELQERLHLLEVKLHTLSDAIEIKDKELTHIRDTLSHQNTQLQHDNHSHHCEAHDSSNNVLQEDLQRSQDLINELMEENSKLKEQITITNQTLNLKSTTEETTTKNFETHLTGANLEVKETQTYNEQNDRKLENSLDKEIAMKHLEEKFTRTMADVANLLEEKQRLEHIVMQLQGETDTIGEYIALYQHQRGILQQRTLEKEEQLRRLRNDRINVRNKLEMVNDLVNKLVQDKGGVTPEILAQHDKLSKSHDENSVHDRYSHNVPFSNDRGERGENNNESIHTADQILQLISEIKSSNLVQPCEGLGDFHPCSCCSGQLLTV